MAICLQQSASLCQQRYRSTVGKHEQLRGDTGDLGRQSMWKPPMSCVNTKDKHTSQGSRRSSKSSMNNATAFNEKATVSPALTPKNKLAALNPAQQTTEKCQKIGGGVDDPTAAPKICPKLRSTDRRRKTSVKRRQWRVYEQKTNTGCKAVTNTLCGERREAWGPSCAASFPS
ncbi:hypothetical protein CERZMDRAFT_102997 [Cercospora zeae-maydis SCOH1-5]|uniref:Uncharacterized protein n=1 Tax=Cercospora zeae-maydis SCOH1-5 TaxID=717836 RepID=A0A6A6F0X2_9PEZI|nr:hypothetical protein CERZMDRAFT_102997 [Cercospora zeae-maydis SCOH1-5]